MLDRREEDVVVAAQRGSKNAFGELVHRYQNLVTSIAFSRTGDLQRSEDIAQQAFLLAWQKRAELRDPSKFGGWLRAITRNITLNSNRKSRRIDRSATTLESYHEPVSTELPGDRIVSEEQQALLWASLKNIPDEYREPLVLFYREDQSVQQVADRLGLTQDAVKQRLVRGRAMLKSEVEQFVEDLLGSTKPSASFSTVVLAALPTAGVVVGKTAAKGSLLWGAKAMFGKLGFLISGPFIGIFGGVLGGVAGVSAAWYGTKTAEKYATSEEEKKLLWWFFKTITYFTLGFTALELVAVFATIDGPTRLAWIIGSTIFYTLVLGWLIVLFINRQKSLHDQFGKPAYSTSDASNTPAPAGPFRMAVIGAAIGCWVWVFVLGMSSQDWIVLGIAIPIFLCCSAWLWVNADFQRTAPDQMRFQAKSLLANSLLAGLLVAAAGFWDSKLNYSAFPNWAMSLAVITICWLIASAIWYAANRVEENSPAQSDL